MKKLLSILICTAILFTTLCGCGGNTTDTDKDVGVDTEESTSQSEELIEYISAGGYEKGIWSDSFYYSRWLNLFFDVSGYGLENNSKINDLSNAIPYDDIEMKFHYGTHESEVGIFLKDCNGKSKETLIEESKKVLTAALTKNSKVLEYEWNEKEKINLCNQEYDLLSCYVTLDISDETEKLKKFGYWAPTKIGCRFWRLCRVKDDKFITIQIIRGGERGPNSEPQFETTLSGFNEISRFDVLQFGNYEQDNNVSNGKEKIEWYVLKKEGDNALVISKKVLDFQKFNVENNNVSWFDSSLKKWLNDVFLNSAFTDDEKGMIMSSEISEEDMISCSLESENENQDKIFILSLKEAETYFKSEKDWICSSTEYAFSLKSSQTNNRYSKDDFSWWVRTPSERGNDRYLKLCYFGGSMDNDSVTGKCGVRPVMWINLKELE